MRDKREKGWFWSENEIIDCDYLKPMERLLYLVLARHSDNKTDESFPSIETLCKKTGVKDKRTIVPYIKNLENLGLISVVRTKGMPNKYYLNNVPKEVDTKIVPSTKNDTTLDTKIVPRVDTKIVPLTILNKKTNKKDSLNIHFDEFWQIYKKKIEKAKCMEKWNKLKESDRELIIKHIPIYEKSLSDIKYLKNPMTYLNSKMWLDDFEEVQVKEKKQFTRQIGDYKIQSL